jgi:hypothetical protein
MKIYDINRIGDKESFVIYLSIISMLLTSAEEIIGDHQCGF